MSKKNRGQSNLLNLVKKIFKEQSALKNSFQDSHGILFNEDCFKTFKNIKDKSIDLILTDLPYGTTQNKWDEILPMDKMWEEFHRIIKDNGAIVLTAAQPFASKLVASNLKHFRYDLIWEKTISSGQLNVNKMPLRSHEHILVFYKKLPTYNEQKTKGTPYSINRDITDNSNYGAQKPSSKVNDGFRHARSVIEIPNPRIKGGHPTQKPLELMDYLIKTYSNEKEIVLDCCVGSGTTLVSAKNLNRGFVGIEIEEEYFTTSKRRLSHGK